MTGRGRPIVSCAVIAMLSAVAALSSCGPAPARVPDAGGSLEVTTPAVSAPSSRALTPVTPAQAQQLERELKAMQRELDSLNMPSDSDFDKAEGQLQ